MINGSSALYNQFNRSVSQPTLRVGIYGNDYFARSVSDSSLKYVYDAIRFSGKLVVFQRVTLLADYELAYSNSSSYTVTESVQLLSGSGSSLLVPTFGKFLDLGSTLFFLYTKVGGVSLNKGLFARFTNNGSTWSGETTLYSGISRIMGFAQVSDTEIYFLEEKAKYGISSSGTNANYTASLKRLIKATSFGVTTVLSTVFVGDGDTQEENRINAAIVDNQRHLLITSGFSQNPNFGNLSYNDYASRQRYSGIKRISLDSNLNIFEEQNIIDVESSRLGVYMSPTRKGNSYYYMALKTYHYPFPSMIIKSINFVDWSTPNILPIGINTEVGSSNVAMSLAVGITVGEPLFSAFNDTSTVAEVVSGTTIHDISGYIMDYQNQNNERISLTLGNKN